MKWLANLVSKFSAWLDWQAGVNPVEKGTGWRLYFTLKKEMGWLGVMTRPDEFRGVTEFVNRYIALVESKYTEEQIEAARTAMK